MNGFSPRKDSIHGSNARRAPGKLDQVSAGAAMVVAVDILGPSFPLAGGSRVIQSDMIPPILPCLLLRHDRGVLRSATAARGSLAPQATKSSGSHCLTAKAKKAKGNKGQMNKTKEEIERIAEMVVDAMLKVHRALGPGLLESAFQACLAHELRCRGIEVGCEVALPVRYEGIEIEVGYRIDTLVAECIVIENKSVQAILPIHEAQLLTYLKLSGHRLGFLVNWNVPLIKDGIKRMVNKL